LKRDDFRDALRLIVVNLSKRFNRKPAEIDVNEFVDDLMFDLKPKELAQLPGLLAVHRREGIFFPSAGEIREKIERLALPAKTYTPYSYPEQVLRRLAPEVVKALESSKRSQGRRDRIPEKDLLMITDGIKNESRQRRREEMKARESGEPVKRAAFVRLGEGMSEEEFKKFLEAEKKKFLDQTQMGKDGPDEK
jgi:hypothetical protein